MRTPQSPIEFIRRTRRLYRQRTAVVDGDRRWTYQQFLERCTRWANALRSLGVQAGDRVAYIAPNTHTHLEGYHAVPLLGAVIVPINYRLTADDFAYIIQHSGARVVCADADYLDAVDSIRHRLSEVKHYVDLSGHREGWLCYEKTLERADDNFEPATVQEEDLISINYTSGTTARPKGVMITHRNAWTNMVGTLLHFPLRAGDPYLWTVPMFHCNGWTFVWIVTAVGGVHVCIRQVEAERVFDMVRQENIKWLCAAPTILMGLANADSNNVPSGVRVVTAAAPPAATTIERLERRLGWEVTQVYGLTETSPLISICEPLPEHVGLTCAERAVVKARQGVELLISGHLRVVEGSGQEVPWDGRTVGEIVVRGNTVMKGYFNDPDATARTMEGGWFHSGDAAVVHPEGYIEVRDRLKDVIISGGENISSVEVEGVLLRHPAIRDVAVVGLPDERWGEAPHAFVVLADNCSATAEEIVAFARAHLAHFKAPKAVHFVESLPRTATGKLQKFVLRGTATAIAPQ